MFLFRTLITVNDYVDVSDIMMQSTITIFYVIIRALCDDVRLCNCCVRELLILARTWFTFGLPSKTGCYIGLLGPLAPQLLLLSLVVPMILGLVLLHSLVTCHVQHLLIMLLFLVHPTQDLDKGKYLKQIY
jgi:hypothetical protein